MRFFQATIDDIPRILPCARQYTEKIPSVDLNEEHYVSFWQSMFESGLGVIYLLEDETGFIIGGIGGIKFPEALTGLMSAVELFWYTDEDHRGQGVILYKMFEKWARENQCRRLAMIYLPCSMPEKLDIFYRRQGFSLREMHYEKELT